MSFTITSTALQHIHMLMNTHAHLRVGIKAGNCNGFFYSLQFEDLPAKDTDTLFEKVVVIDPKSLQYLNEAILDWSANLTQYGFIIRNPQEKSQCGCGKSFSLEKNK